MEMGRRGTSKGWLKASFLGDQANLEMIRCRRTKSQFQALHMSQAFQALTYKSSSRFVDQDTAVFFNYPYSMIVEMELHLPDLIRVSLIFASDMISSSSHRYTLFSPPPQNLNLGPTKTSKKAAIHNPAIIAYNLILPHQPFPSVILLSVVILFPAASIPILFLSNPPSALLRTSFSFSKELANCMDDCLRLFASVTSDVVRRS